MRTLTYTGSLLTVVLAGHGGAAFGQDNCETQIEELRNQLEQQQVGDEVRRQVQQLLAAAEDTQNCQPIVTEARGQLSSAQQQEPQPQQQQAQAQPRTQDDATEVQVEQQAAEIDVQTPAPQVAVEQQPTEVQVEQQEPEVRIEQPEPEVTVQQEEPQVTVEQAEPEVQVRQAEPEVEVRQSEPEVEVIQPESDAQVRTEQQDAQQEQEAREGEQQQQEAIQPTRSVTLSEREAQQLVGQPIETRDGERVGEISEVVQSHTGDQYHAVADIGGFLGIGSERKAIPFDDLELDPEGNVVALMSRDELEQMQPYDEQQYMPLQEQDRASARAGGGEAPAFEEVDADEDGRISRTELAMVEGIEFSSADQNQDGSVSRQEYEQAVQQQ